MSDVTLSKAVRSNLMSLQNTAAMMDKTQSRLATGNKVNSALDNPSNFFTAAALNSRAADMNNLLDAMASGIKVIEAANNGLTALTKNLESMQSTLRQARQDKSFQTQSFEVTDNSVITFGGGRFDLDSVIKLADAEAKQGTPAQLTSIGSTPYLGPTSGADAAKGAGARAVISGLDGLTANSKITVAGVEVDVGTDLSAEALAQTIQNTLDGDNLTVGQYKVMAGAADSVNAGKIIIETIDTKAPPATIAFGDGTTEAVKGSVTFNFNDLNNSIKVGDQEIEHGGTFEDFIANLEAHAEEGGYDIKVDADKNITLTAKEYGVAAPQVQGVPPGAPAQAASTSFTVSLASTDQVTVAGQNIPMGGTLSSATYQISLTGTNPSTIKVGGHDVTIPAATGNAADDAAAAAQAINTVLTDNNLNYTATVSNTGELRLTSNTVDASTPPLVETGTVHHSPQTVQPGTVTQGSPGEKTVTTYQVALDGAAPSTIKVGSANIVVAAGSSDKEADANALKSQIEAALTAQSLAFDVEVDEDGNVTFTATAVGDDPTPTITTGDAITGAVVTPDTGTEGNGSSTSSTKTFSISGGFPSSGLVSIKIDGDELVLDASATQADLQTTINSALTAAYGGDYTAVVDKDNGLITVSRTDFANTPVPGGLIGGGTSVAVQNVAAGDEELGTDPTATTAEYEIDIGITTGPTTITVGNQEVTIPAATGVPADDADAAETAINDALVAQGLAFTATVDVDGKVTLTAANTGNIPAPTITSGTTTVTNQTVAPASNVTTGAASGPETVDTLKTKIQSALSAAGQTGLEVTVQDDGNGNANVSIVATTAGARPAIEVSGDGAVVTEPPQPGLAATAGAIETPSVTGVSFEHVDPAEDTFQVTYDGKKADISITGLKLGAGPLDRVNWQADTIESINTQLETQGVKGVEAKFDDNGKLTLVAKTAEAKTIAISRDASNLFGQENVSTGTPTETGLNATKTTDKFVEFINKKFGGQVRASNDNGKLRIENLSTQELNIGVDKNGNGAVETIKVEGNSVRANLSKQFNELRDQLDKLADDASFNGINLLRGDKLKITFNESGTSSIDIQAKDKNGNVRGINASNLNIDTLSAEDLDTDEAIDKFLATLATALTELRSQASSFGSNLSAVENRQSFTKNMINTLETGAANLTLADTNEEAANLLALQTRQQLSSSALSMASQQDQAVLQLLR